MDFYFTITSDSKSPVNPVILRKHILLDKKYVVALTEINISPIMFSLGSINLYSIDSGRRKFEARFNVYAFENETYFKIIERLDDEISKFFIHRATKQGTLFNERDKKSYENFELDLTTPFTLKFQKNLEKTFELIVVGEKLAKLFETTRLSTEKEYTIADPTVTRFSYSNVLLIQLNIIDYQYYNNEQHQILRVINTTQPYFEFNTRNYLSINRTEIYSLSLSICDSKGEHLKFKNLKYTAVLHFKPRDEFLYYTAE